MTLRLTFLCTAFLLLFFPFQPLRAQDCFQDWTFRLPVEVNNTLNATPAVDMQVRLVINTADLVTAGQMQASGADIRFVDSENCCLPLCYWIENGMNTTATTIWVKVPVVAASASRYILMLTGNPGAAPGGDGDCTFLFFDGFDGASLDPGKWTTRGTPSLSTVSGGYLTFSGNNNWEYIRSNTTWPGPIGVHYKGRASAPPSAALVMGMDATDNRFTFRINSTTLGTTWDNDVSGGNAWEDSNYPNIAGATTTDANYELWPSLSGSGKIQISHFCNTTASDCNLSSKTLNAFTGTSMFVGFTSYSPAFVGMWDYIFVRKMMAAEVTASLGGSLSAHLVPEVSGDSLFCEGSELHLEADPGYLSYLWSTGDTSSTTTVYSSGTVSWFINDSVCSYIDSLSVTALPSPLVEITPGDMIVCPGTALSFSVGGGYASVLWGTGDSTDTVTITAPAFVTVMVTDSSGCSTGDTVSIFEHTVLSPEITPDISLPVCEGAVVTLDAGAGYVSYNWSPDSTQTTEVSASGFYSVEVTDSNGCLASDTFEVVIWPLPVPMITVSGTILDAGPGYLAYQWYLDGLLIPAGVNQTYDGIVPGSYSVVVTDSNGCTGEADSVLILLGQFPPASGGSVLISPNPSGGSFTVQVKALTAGKLKIEMMDLQGRVLLSEEAESILGAFERTYRDALPSAGIYLLRITQGEKAWTGRIVRN
jgi:hypothetical protein